MLPAPAQGIGALQLPQLPPVPSGPNPTQPGSFSQMYDGMKTKADQMPMAPLPQLPTAMEVRPIMPNLTMDQPWQDSVEFPDAVGADGLKLPGQPKARPVTPTGDTKSTDGPVGFLDPLMSAFQDTNKLQHNAEKLTNEAAIGGDVDLHDVMIATEKASVAMNLTMQVRNRLIDAYQEVMRMQV